MLSTIPPARTSIGAQDSQWLVSRGGAVVGPVSTDLLLRGITQRRVPHDCVVKQPSWTTWRGLEEIRETRPLREAPTWQQNGAAEVNELLRSAQDVSEALSLVLGLAVIRTGAHVGLVHRSRRGLRALSPVACYGLEPHEALTAKVDPLDPAVQKANEGGCSFGAPKDDSSTRASSARIGGSILLSGVLAIPIRNRGQLVALIELGRYDHPFRTSDSRRGEALASIAANHFARAKELDFLVNR